MSPLEQINRIRAEISRLKPRSTRRAALEARLVLLVAQQMRREVRLEKRKAA